MSGVQLVVCKILLHVFMFGWCNLHSAGCIIQVAGHVLWPRAAWLYQEAVTHKKANISVSGGLQIVGM